MTLGRAKSFLCNMRMRVLNGQVRACEHELINEGLTINFANIVVPCPSIVLRMAERYGPLPRYNAPLCYAFKTLDRIWRVYEAKKANDKSFA